MAEDNKSFINLFKPPETLTGISMALSAMSAEEKTVSEISRTFTNRRFRNGYLFGHLFLDNRNDGLFKSGRICEGIYHYQNKVGTEKNLLHAKVMLLAFGKSALNEPSVFRVIVYTGNLTSTSVNNHLELIWTFDLDKEEDDEEKKDDLREVLSFFESLQDRYYDLPYEKVNSLKQLLSWGQQRVGGLKSSSSTRFTHTFKKPIIDHLKSSLMDRRGFKHIICGSGFFELAGTHDKCPETVRQLEECIKGFESGKIVMNPDFAGALSNWKNPAGEGWSIHIPLDGDSLNRRLHAKYVLFSTTDKKKCERGIFYMGSGNISKLGMIEPFEKGGNIEVGVILELREESKILDRLFVGSEYNGKILPGDGGDEHFLNTPPIPHCPVLTLKVEETGTKIVWCADTEPGTQVIIIGEPISFPDDVLKSKTFKGSVSVSYNGHEFIVPVISYNGLICEQKVSITSFQEALDFLESFQNQTWDDRDEGDITIADIPEIPSVQNSSHSLVRKYPLHTAAELVEKLAHMNNQIGDEPTKTLEWIEFLESHFSELFHEDDVKTWKDLGFDFLSILKQRPFSVQNEQQIERYQKLINDIISKWKFDELAKI